jgi:signal transduction histidine kinase
MPTGSKPLRVLLVEDNDDDAQLVLLALSRGGYSPKWERVDTPEAMRAALEKTWDVILCDYSMPRFSAPAAFALVRERRLDLPFVIISGTVGEEAAVEAMRSGVHDYLLKDKLARLVPVVERELREAAGRAEQRRMQEQLFISDRMASVGTLAAGVAHEINNPLTYINILVGRLSSLEASSARDALSLHRLEILNEVREGLRRVERIAEDLRTYSRHDDDKQASTDVQGALDSALRIAAHEIRHRAQLVKAYQPVPLVRGSDARLGQVFLNLIMNAAQSMAEGEAHTNQLRVSTQLLDDGRIAIEIADTGTGIPNELLGKIFEPFFTTKKQGEGTGLGLSICRGIVNGLGGELSVRSELGKGSSFRVVLPPGEARPALPPARATTPGFATRGRRARILVVDDDERVGQVVASVLGDEHEVAVAQSGREALSMLEGDGEFDLIVCDLMMPEISGVDLYEALVLVRPQLAHRFLFMTAGAFTRSAAHFLARVKPAQIHKPFEASALHQAVAHAIVAADREIPRTPRATPTHQPAVDTGPQPRIPPPRAPGRR